MDADDPVTIERAGEADAAEIYALQLSAYATEDARYPYTIPPLLQTFAEAAADCRRSLVLKAVTADGRIIGSVRGLLLADGRCQINKLMVLPDCRGRGTGSQLLRAIESTFPGCAFELFTGTRSTENIRLYKRHGYQVLRTDPQKELVYLQKKARLPAGSDTVR